MLSLCLWKEHKMTVVHVRPREQTPQERPSEPGDKEFGEMLLALADREATCGDGETPVVRAA